jgi:vancomycin resistance protein VanJ
LLGAKERMGTDKALFVEACTQFKKAWPLLVSMATACFLTLLYCARPDAFAAITSIPAWGWLVLFVPVLPFLRRKYRFPALLCSLAWLFFALVHVEEPKAMLRGLLSPIESTRPPGALRLVTLNCGGGKPTALQEAADWSPDIVFLQESPPRKEVERFARELFGEEGACVWDIDTSIVLRGNLQSLRPQGMPPFFSLAVSLSPDIGEVILISLRLWPGIPEVELWDPQCWRSQTKLRLAQLQQMRQLVALLDTTKPLIVAGDFNAPQGDKIFSLLPDTLYDSFRAQGRGIGNTIVNDMPLVRIDQIWVSREFDTLQSFAVKSGVSDHRMVITDVKIKR